MYGNSEPLQVFGVRLIGATSENARKLLLTVVFIVVVLILGWMLRALLAAICRSGAFKRTAFWARQAINLLVTVLLLSCILSIWVNDPGRLATAFGLFTAGLAFALQRVITATAGYFVVLRGNTFSIGDRIVMGGVRGDVIALSFMQTTIMEMGQASPSLSESPGVWVRSRQYTGRIVTVSNARVFDEPVYNYTRDFPYIWDEISVPVRYLEHRDTVEKILLKAARKHSADLAELAESDLAELRQRYFIANADLAPRVYWRLTNNWLELTVRFLTRDHGARELKDAMSRDILAELDAAGIRLGSASQTLEVVGLPPVQVEPASVSKQTG
jgi:small-conductance mechanosensitive channel